MTTIKLSIVIPCYNEQKNIPLLLEQARHVIHRDDVEVILVNNGSTDDSARTLEELAPLYDFVRYINITPNRGYGGGILSGLEIARGNYIGWTHADMQADLSDAIKALSIIEGRGDPKDIYLKGLRSGRPWIDMFFTAGMSIAETFYLRAPLWDINAQPNIFHRFFYMTWNNPPFDYSLDLYAYYMARRGSLNIIRFNVAFLKRAHGSSSWNTSIAGKWRFIRRTISSSIKVKKNVRALPSQ